MHNLNYSKSPICTCPDGFSQGIESQQCQLCASDFIQSELTFVYLGKWHIHGGQLEIFAQIINMKIVLYQFRILKKYHNSKSKSGADDILDPVWLQGSFAKGQLDQYIYLQI